MGAGDRGARGRVFLLILDSVGCGAMPDAALYGDEGADTLGHAAEAAGAQGLRLPAMGALGLGNVSAVRGVAPVGAAAAALWGKMAKKSPGKDTTTGHWELAGFTVAESFRVFPDGFPGELVRELEEKSGARFTGNVPASGTVIIEQLGTEHLATGKLILYTSADSVIQVAAHEEAVPLERLYAVCRAALEAGSRWNIARVIARPFVGEPGAFRRTYNRKDFTLAAGGRTMLDALAGGGVPVTGVGKIHDIFSGRGVTESIHTEGNDDGAAVTLDLARRAGGGGLVFVNFVDFDMVYGHRRDAAGYAAALEKIDGFVGALTPLLREGDLAILTADHGCDPVHAGSDHTREYVPLLVWGPAAGGRRGPAGTRETFCDVAETVLHHFGFPPLGTGKRIELEV